MSDPRLRKKLNRYGIAIYWPLRGPGRTLETVTYTPSHVRLGEQLEKCLNVAPEIGAFLASE